MEALGTPTQVLIAFRTVPASPHTQCACPNNGAARSNCAHLSHFVQLLEQLKLADSLATTSRPTQRLTQHRFSFYTAPEKGTELFSQIYLSKLSRWCSITVAESLSYLK